MKKLMPSVILFFCSIIFIPSFAQIKIQPQQVKEILIRNASGGMAGSRSAEIQVINEAGKWNSYLIHKSVMEMGLRSQSSDSILHRFIAVLPAAVINDMLNGIAVVKPRITRSTFNLTSAKLIAELKAGAKSPVKNPPDFEKWITQTLIDKMIAKTVVNEIIMDVFESSEVDVITRQKDTLKLSASIICPTMQPWKIGHHNTYDMTINNFVVAAIGNEDIPNRSVLNVSSLKESIYNAIDSQHKNAPIASYKWDYYYPKQLKMLNANFTDIKTRFMNGNIYYCRLRTASMPPAAFLESTIDMTNQNDIRQTIVYAKLINEYFKTDNFVLKYYGNLPGAYIGFSNYTGRSPYRSLNFLDKKFPELAKSDSTKTIFFFAGTADDTANWIIFPDNKSLLTYHSVTTTDGKSAPIYPPQDPNSNWTVNSNTYYLFDNKGKVLTQGYRL